MWHATRDERMDGGYLLIVGVARSPGRRGSRNLRYGGYGKRAHGDPKGGAKKLHRPKKRANVRIYDSSKLHQSNLVSAAVRKLGSGDGAAPCRLRL